jgi:hypothetical protein
VIGRGIVRSGCEPVGLFSTCSANLLLNGRKLLPFSFIVGPLPGISETEAKQQAVEKGQKFAREDGAETSQNDGSALEEIPR